EDKHTVRSACVQHGFLSLKAALAIFFKASAEDLGRAPHAHPSLSEILKEAALAAWERPIHL
ncbi:MAG: hypothetical protein ACUVS9_02935, partial [Thermaceae bacterium]